MKITLSGKKIGLFLMVLYVFFSFNAKDIIIPSIFNSIFLYIFLGFGLLYLLLNSSNGAFIRTNTYTGWYIAVLIIFLLTALYAPEFSILSGEYYLMLVSFGLILVIQQFVKSESDFYVLAWSFAIAAFFFIATLFLTGNLITSQDNRLGGDIVGNANTFATMIMIATMWDLWLFIYGHKKIILRVILAAMILVNMYALILSAGRSAFIVPFVFLYVLLLSKTDKKGRKHFIKYTLIIVAIIIFVWQLIMNVPAFYESIGYRFESYINGIRGISAQGSSASIRDKLRNAAFTQAFYSPIWGHGFDSFRWYAKSLTGTSYYSHCNFSEILYNGGIICFVLYYSFYYKVLRKAYLQSKGSMKFKAFAIALIAALLVYDYSIVSYSIAQTQIMLAMAFNCLDFENEEELIYE